MDRQQLIAALRNLKQYDGVTGPIRFEGRGNVQRSYTVYTVHNGAFVPVTATSPVGAPQ
jgi:ABC-type branched-subunit amino acid transport system substrate-binding protein